MTALAYVVYYGMLAAVLAVGYFAGKKQGWFFGVVAAIVTAMLLWLSVGSIPELGPRVKAIRDSHSDAPYDAGYK